MLFEQTLTVEISQDCADYLGGPSTGLLAATSPKAASALRIAGGAATIGWRAGWSASGRPVQKTRGRFWLYALSLD